MAAESIVIPAILPLTGPSADLGRSVANGMTLAAEDENRRTSRHFQLRLLNSLGKPTEALTVYRAANPTSRAGTVLSWMSSAGSALMPVALRDSVALFVGAASPSLTSSTGLIIRVWPRAQEIGERMGEYALDRHLRSVAIIYIDDEYGRSVAQAFRGVAERGGIRIVTEESVPVGATDIRLTLERIKSLRPQAVYVPAYGSVYTSGLKQIREVLGPSVMVMADLPLLSAFSLPQLGDELENLVVTATALDVKPYQTQAAKQFAERYRTRFGRDADFNAGLGYMMFAIAARAISSGADGGQRLASYVSKVSVFDGPLGPIRYDTRGDCDVPIQIAQFRNRRLWPLTPLRRADGHSIDTGSMGRVDLVPR